MSCYIEGNFSALPVVLSPTALKFAHVTGILFFRVLAARLRYPARSIPATISCRRLVSSSLARLTLGGGGKSFLDVELWEREALGELENREVFSGLEDARSEKGACCRDCRGGISGLKTFVSRHEVPLLVDEAA